MCFRDATYIVWNSELFKLNHMSQNMTVGFQNQCMEVGALCIGKMCYWEGEKIV